MKRTTRRSRWRRIPDLRFSLPDFPTRLLFSSSGDITPHHLRRLIAFGGFGLIGLVVIALRLFLVQVMHHDAYFQVAADQHYKSRPLPPDRGRIMDRNGEILAHDLTLTSFGISKHNKRKAPEDQLRDFIHTFTHFTGQQPDSLMRALKQKNGFSYLAKKVDSAIADRIIETEEYKKVRAYIEVESQTRRIYPLGQTAGQILGFCVDGQGSAGFELAGEELLRGREGFIVERIDARRKPYDRLDELFQPARAGADVVLTIDAAAQKIAEDVLHETVQYHNARGGMILVMQPATGEILAMASEPSFDPNAPQSTPFEHQKIRPVVDMYEPGSTFKLVASTAALDTRLFTPDRQISTGAGQISVGRHTITDHEKMGVLSLQGVIEHSSNVGTIKIAQTLGDSIFFQYVRAFGFGMKTGVTLPGEVRGVLRSPDRWSSSTLATMAIGYGLSVTGLQLITAYSAIANGGLLMEPRIIREIHYPNGETLQLQPKTVRRVMSPETSQTMRSILQGVVDNGTGKKAAIRGFHIAGKTGTAWKAREDGPGYTRNYRSSFVGMIPADDPEMVVLVMIDEPKAAGFYGGAVAAPAFQKAVRNMAHLPSGLLTTEPVSEDGSPLYLALLQEEALVDTAEVSEQLPELAEEEGTAPTDTTLTQPELNPEFLSPALTGGIPAPSVIGLPVRQAIDRLTKAGFHPTVLGSGVVVRQTPSAGSPGAPGDRFLIECQPADLIAKTPTPSSE